MLISVRTVIHVQLVGPEKTGPDKQKHRPPFIQHKDTIR